MEINGAKVTKEEFRAYVLNQLKKRKKEVKRKTKNGKSAQIMKTN